VGKYKNLIVGKYKNLILDLHDGRAGSQDLEDPFEPLFTSKICSLITPDNVSYEVRIEHVESRSCPAAGNEHYIHAQVLGYAHSDPRYSPDVAERESSYEEQCRLLKAENALLRASLSLLSVGEAK